MDYSEQPPQKLMVLVSLIQGLCLLYLHQAIELEFWPHHQPQWLFAFYSLALIWPTMLLLGLQPGNTPSMVKFTLPFALLSALLGYYVGHQATPVDHVRYDNLLGGYVITMAVATFKALMFSQQLAAGEPISYSALFRWSWRNFLTLALALIFAGCVWLIFLLWAGLFKAINIHFFWDLFTEPWFYYPAIALANGFGVIVFRRLTQIIDTITRLQQALMKFLLVFLVFISLLFLGTLPFTGLDPLWKSGGSALILVMQALMLFFVNAVYQDEPEQRPYPLWIHRFIYVGVALLPIYSAISFYGLSIRVDQYGWSLDRCWAFLIWFLLALFPLGYWWGIARKRDNWVYQLSPVNITVGLVVLAMMLLINSPLLDFRKVVVNNQLQRLANNQVKPDEFDFWYFRRSLAKPGYEGLQQLKTQYSETHPDLLVRINELYRDPRGKQPVSTEQEFITAIDVLAGNPSAELLSAIYGDKSRYAGPFTGKYYLRSLDLNDDDREDYLLVAETRGYLSLTLYFLLEDKWQSLPLTAVHITNNKTQQQVIEALKAGDLKIVPPEWNNLQIGEKHFQIGVQHGDLPSLIAAPR